MSIEYVTNTENTIDVFENEIDENIKYFCEENNIQDICSISQSVFNGMLIYIYRKCFKGTNKLKNNNIYTNVGVKNNSSTNCNSYNITLINKLCDYYIFICRLYDKEISLTGFSYLTGIDKDTFYDWRDGERKRLSFEHAEIYKKLNQGREESLSDKLATGNKNPVGILAILNHHYNWAGVGNMEERKPQTVRLSDVQKTASLLSDNLPQDGQQIDQKQPVKLSDN